jgi:phosphoribosylglycinamide formyltransferase-1
MNFAVLASGNGSNLQAIIKAVKTRKIKANLAVVISDKADAFALARARKAKIPTVVINPKDYPDRESFDRELVRHLRVLSVDFVVLAGFMRILSAQVIKAYPNKIINIHPALLPAFKGARAIQDAFEFGVKITGVTVHFVDEQVDHGAIIAQEAVLILPKDTLKKLEQRIHAVEHRIYPKAISLFAAGKITVLGSLVSVR